MDDLSIMLVHPSLDNEILRSPKTKRRLARITPFLMLIIGTQTPDQKHRPPSCLLPAMAHYFQHTLASLACLEPLLLGAAVDAALNLGLICLKSAGGQHKVFNDG